MFLVSQGNRLIWNASVFLCIGKRPTSAEIEGIMPNDKVVLLASYDCDELAELDFNLLKNALEKGSKIFYFSKEAEEK